MTLRAPPTRRTASAVPARRCRLTTGGRVHHNGPMTFTNGEVSFWYRDIGLPTTRAGAARATSTPTWPSSAAAYTGLWTAYYLKQAEPDLRIVGAGEGVRRLRRLGAQRRLAHRRARPGRPRRYAADARLRARPSRMQRQMFDAVDEVIAVAAKEGIDADIVKDGVLHVATNPAQARPAARRVARARTRAGRATDLGCSTPRSWRERHRASPARSARALEPALRAHPAGQAGAGARRRRRAPRRRRSTRARAVTGSAPRGPVTRARDGPRGDVRPARHRGLHRATCRGARRDWLPMNSSMIVTEPLPRAVWEEIGWAGRETARRRGARLHATPSAPPTAGSRIGGRGRALPLGSRTDDDGAHPAADHRRSCGRSCTALFPAAAGAPRSTHAWSGVLGVPRDWCATVGLDRATGLGWAGGYVGHGRHHDQPGRPHAARPRARAATPT